MPEKFTDNEIKTKLLNCGYILRSEYKDTNNRVDLEDNDGYWYCATPSSIYNNGNKIMPFHSKNPHTIRNIRLWIIKNNMPIELVSDVFVNAIENLEWKCLVDGCGQTFPASWHSIKSGHKCSYCTGKRITKEDSIAVQYPHLLKDWDFEKNIGLDPYSISYGSSLPVNWKCHICGYEWNTVVSSRTKGTGCSACSGRILSDKNRLTIRYPDVAAEWHPTKNGDLKPEDISYGANKEVWWLCLKCGHEWISSVGNRCGGNKGCPECAKELTESKLATKLKEYCEYKYKAIKEYRIIKNPETGRWLPFDIYIPEYKIFIEVMGSQHYAYYERFHRTYEKFLKMQWRDKLKKEFALENGVYFTVDLRKISKLQKSIELVDFIITEVKDKNLICA